MSTLETLMLGLMLCGWFTLQWTHSMQVLRMMGLS